MAERAEGFPPVYDEHSRVLILGSFPSVRSRREGFYYGNPQNKFWKMLSAFFGEPLPATPAEKRTLVLGHGVALWDMVVSCEIEGSADDSIRGEHVADIGYILGYAPIKRILCNGAKSYELLAQSKPAALSIAEKMPSTSPANPRYRETVWHDALAEAFRGA